MTSTLAVRPITSDDQRASLWTTQVELQSDGESLAFLKLSSKYGTLLFGTWSDGHVGWRWEETGGGGAAVIPYALEDGKQGFDALWIGMLLEERQNMGGKRLCVPGGFKRPGEKPDAAAQREAMAETGAQRLEITVLRGFPINGCRSYFTADPDKGEGVDLFAASVPFADLIPALDGTMQHGTWQPKGCTVVFLPWSMAVQQTADAVALSGIVRLLAQLTENPDG